MAKTGNKGRGVSLLAVLFYFAIGAACGFLFVRYMDTVPFGAGSFFRELLLPMAVMILAIYAAIFLQIIIHEAGHLVFGLLTGYRFSSFRIGTLMLVKTEGKLKWKRMKLAGTGGQCLMLPPDLADGRMPFMLYNFGGSIMNLISAVLALGIAFLFPPASFLRVFLLSFALIGAAFALMNGLPLRLGPVDNDGKNALSMRQDPEAVRAFWAQLKVNGCLAEGMRVREMPADWFAMPPREKMGNALTASAAVLYCARLMDEHRFKEAGACMEEVLSSGSGIPPLTRVLLTCDQMYVEMVTAGRRETVDAMRTKEQVKGMKAMATSPGVLRTEYVYALWYGADRTAAGAWLRKFEKRAKNYPYPTEIEGERELIAIADQAAAERKTADM
ncbi:MAG: M50 family metallopeptidase [Clostridia bacterium]|nr:M50 family metallopeptidase [Clostridia bacterium]